MLGFFANGMMGGFGAILAENYPAEARSTAENFIFGTGRGLAGFGPVIIGLLAAGGKCNGSIISYLHYLSNRFSYNAIICPRDEG